MSDNKKHSIVSPSSAHRWVACTPSARLCAEFGDNTTSAYAEEGTRAHELAEELLKIMLTTLTQPKEMVSGRTKKLDDMRKSDWYSSEMEDYVKQYTGYVEKLARQDKHSFVFIEEKVPLFYAENDKGTIDSLILSPETKTMYVTDLKYGKGVEVSAVENLQLIIYAISAQKKYADMEFARFVLCIQQPRISSVSIHEIDNLDLAMWEAIISDKAAKALRGEGEQIAGEHCRFCSVKARCKAQKDNFVKLKEQKENTPGILTVKDLSDILPYLDAVADWIIEVKAYALEQALKGEKFDGYKLIAGRKSRKIADEKGILEALEKAGYEKGLFKKVSTVGLTEMLKIVDKKDFEMYCEKYLKIEECSPKLVPESEKGEEYGISKAKDDFAEYIK